ncbi:Beta-galactoside-specific lectin 3 [Madurella mycetomatis]|uniref:Beta-galactoside-specific lectin 3 n=1 Tax=Madurella mycetomatis TaxID=100816 RepID=A0A175W8M4_9PEZI|nr:Beta-galactoside-specific lectin 3 [Madurella mycetomatis]KXX82914.1 Beta-galactoside-specific lectin 3 [Madurella mycetomatis]
MFVSIFLLALAATGISQEAPEGYRKVYITSMVNTNFVVVPRSRTAGSPTVVQTLNNSPEQQWYIKDGNTKIQLVDTNLCLDAGAQSNWRDMGTLTVNDCSDTAESQNWFVMGDGRIALEPSNQRECIDLQYMRAVENNPVVLFNCAGLGNTGAADKGINWPLLNVTD